MLTKRRNFASLSIKQVWKAYDRNENGYIDPHEATLLFSDMFSWNPVRTPQHKYDAVFNILDADGDGRISKEEFTSFMSA